MDERVKMILLVGLAVFIVSRLTIAPFVRKVIANRYNAKRAQRRRDKPWCRP
jgi:hypothetical protein